MDGWMQGSCLSFFLSFSLSLFLSVFPSLVRPSGTSVRPSVRSFGRPVVHAFLPPEELGCDCGGGLRG